MPTNADFAAEEAGAGDGSAAAGRGHTEDGRPGADIAEHNASVPASDPKNATLHAVIDSSVDPIFAVDRNYRYRMFNSSHARLMKALFGKDISIGANILDYHINPIDRGVAQGNLDRALNGERVEVEYYCGDDHFERRYLAVSHNPIRVATGEVTGVAVFARDLIERKKAEEALQESERFVRATLDGLSAHIAIVNREGVIEAVNRPWRDFAATNGLAVGNVCEGANYLATCNSAVGEDADAAHRFAQGLRDVLAGGQGRFEMEYPCHSPQVQRWFVGRVTRFPGDGPVRAVVAHENITQRKMAAQALHESEQRLRLAVEAATLGTYSFDHASNTGRYSKEFLALYGLKPDEPLALGPDMAPMAVVDEDRPAFLAAMAAGNDPRGDGVMHVEFRIRRANGAIRWLMTRGRTTFAGRPGAQRPDRAAGVLMDITERRQAEEQLRLQASVLSQAPDVVMRFDRECRHIYVSPNVQAIVDLTPEQFLGKTHRQLGFTNDQCDAWETAIRAVFGTGRPFQGSFSFHGKTGLCHFDWRIVPELDGKGRVQSVLSIARDITIQRRLEADYSNLFDAMLDGFAVHEIILDEAGRPVDYRFLAVNPAFERMTGLRRADVLGKTVLQVMPGTERHWIEVYGKVATTGQPERFEDYAKELGKHFEVLAFRPREGQFACVFQDVTQRKRLESQLRDAQKMEAIGRLAGGIAHDFRNQLTIIKGYAEMLIRLSLVEMEGRPLIDEILAAARRGTEVTGELLAFSRRDMLRPQVARVSALLAAMRGSLAQLVGENIDVSILGGDVDCPVDLAVAQFERAVLNLAANARDAMPKGGQLTISTACLELDATSFAEQAEIKPGRYLCVSVTDTGCGMSKDVMARLFEPFFTTKKPGEGTGLGLAMVYGFAKQSGGLVNVLSEPGRGATVQMYFPCADRVPEASQLPIERTPAPVGRETVLLVEDEEPIRRLLAQSLMEAGYTVLEAGSAWEAAEVARGRADRLDILVTDLVMPGGSGAALAESARQWRPGIPVLFISGYGNPSLPGRDISLDRSELLVKPFKHAVLLATVRRLLDAAR